MNCKVTNYLTGEIKYFNNYYELPEEYLQGDWDIDCEELEEQINK